MRPKGCYGYVDERGELVIESRFYNAGAIEDDRAEVIVDGKVGTMDRTSAFVLEPRSARVLAGGDVVLAQPARPPTA